MDLAPARYAALVAPAVDRLFAGLMSTVRSRGGADIGLRYGGPPAIGYLIEFRTRLARPDGVVPPDGFAAVTRYRDAGKCAEMLRGQADHGMIEISADGSVTATDRGRAFLAEIRQLQAQVIGELWTGERAGRVAEVLARLLTAATATGGPAYSVMYPPYEPPDSPIGVLLLDRLGTLRYHRADAHAAAWQAAGLTAAEIVALPPGPARAAIEADTDARAAAPYAILTEEERLVLLADLAALPT